MVKWIITVILLLPLAEIVVFIAVAAWIGFGSAVALMLLTSLAGALILRRTGRRRFAHFRVAMTGNGIAGIEGDGSGLIVALAGVLLLVPGFLTDLIGTALLIAPVRRLCGKAIRSWLQRRQADPSVVDLAPEDWHKVPDRELPDRSDRPG